MENPTDEKIPFTEKPGALFVAPLGSELPQHIVRDGQFAMAWPATWIPVLPVDTLTDPGQCSDRSAIDTDAVQVSDFLEPIRLVTSRAVRWDFGPEVRASRALRMGAGSVRLMVGWESEDRADRVVARQAFIDEFGDVQLEQATSPAPAPPRLKWWERLLRRRPAVGRPTLHPLYEVYSVGVLRKERHES